MRGDSELMYAVMKPSFEEVYRTVQDYIKDVLPGIVTDKDL